jgi:nucleoid-associated protein YgaU
MGSAKSLVIAAVLIAAGIGAAVLYVVTRDDGTGTPPREDEQARTVLEAPTQDAAPAMAPPSFDVVRVDPRGTAVVAGRGAPRASVSLMAGDQQVATAEIDAAGEWVIVLSDPLPTGTIELSLLMSLPDGQEVRSDQVVVVSVPESRAETPLVVLGRPGEASEVLQGPFDGVGMGPLVLETVDYDETGEVIFSGRAEPNARVRVLADERLIGETQADSAGRWTLQAPEGFEPGVYDLQVDQLDEEGRVTAVIALPFERASAEAIEMAGERVVVQPGNSLWRIARELYGEGMQYTVIYEANRDQIRDPDLIYPGQIFTTPQDG